MSLPCLKYNKGTRKESMTFHCQTGWQALQDNEERVLTSIINIDNSILQHINIQKNLRTKVVNNNGFESILAFLYNPAY